MVKVILVGLGSLGEKIAAFLMERKDVRLVAVVDPRKAGKDVGQEATEKKNGLLIYGELETAVKKHRPEVAILATVSRIETLEPLVAQLASLKLSIVSTCEELSYPWKAHPLCARRIDRMCRAKKVACLATGVNPGYLMDYLPLVLTLICQQVTRIEVQRVQNARKRRLSFQKKIGTGLTVAEFRRLLQQGQICHVGLRESMDMLAAFSGWQKVKTVERIRPVIARKKIKTLLGVVTPGGSPGWSKSARPLRDRKKSSGLSSAPVRARKTLTTALTLAVVLLLK